MLLFNEFSHTSIVVLMFMKINVLKDIITFKRLKNTHFISKTMTDKFLCYKNY